MWKRFASGYLDFTGKERTGVLVMLSLILFFVLLPYAFPYFIREKIYEHADFEKALTSLQLKTADSTGRYLQRDFKNANTRFQYTGDGRDAHSATKGVLFYFDPNNATRSDWQRLGVRDKTIATIQKFLTKGGKFYQKEDIGKIWGLHKSDVERLMPYIRIENKSGHYADKTDERQPYKKAVFTPAKLEINTADTSAFIALPGIGSKLSQRIVHFREKLGGFYSVDQIGETFGLQDSVFQRLKDYLRIGNTAVHRININDATIDQLKEHPYIRYQLANAIVGYRKQHGNYTSVTDIKKIMLVTEPLFNKLEHYLTVD